MKRLQSTNASNITILVLGGCSALIMFGMLMVVPKMPRDASALYDRVQIGMTCPQVLGVMLRWPDSKGGCEDIVSDLHSSDLGEENWYWRMSQSGRTRIIVVGFDKKGTVVSKWFY